MYVHARSRYAGDPRDGTDGAQLAVVHSRRQAGSELATWLSVGRNHVRLVRLGRAVVQRLADEPCDLLLVDHSSDDFDAARVCGDLRRALGIPILVVSTPERVGDEPWVIKVLERGATDVLAAGTSAGLLLAKLRAALRTAPPPHRGPQRLVAGDVVVDLDAHAVFVAGREAPFPPLLFGLFVTLASLPNQAVPTDTLLARVWGLEPSADRRRVRVAVSQLRRLLGAGPRRPRVETVSLLGYRLAVPS